MNLHRLQNRFFALLFSHFPRLTERWLKRQPIEDYGPPPWTPLHQPLSACTVALVTTAGVHLKDDAPFDIGDKEGDPTYRVIPLRKMSIDMRAARIVQSWLLLLATGLLFCSLVLSRQVVAEPTPTTPLSVKPETKEVQVWGFIYPARFNAAQGNEVHYHLLVWQGGKSANALIETPADDLAFHDALVALGAQPGDNLTMASWHERHNAHSSAPWEKVLGSSLEVRISWKSNPAGISVPQAFHPTQFATPDSGLQTPHSALDWRFGGNRARWFNRVPLAPRPGCLACLYSCPSGKVSNGALSIHDYVRAPSRFMANTAILPPDGTPVIVTFRVQP